MGKSRRGDEHTTIRARLRRSGSTHVSFHTPARPKHAAFTGRSDVGGSGMGTSSAHVRSPSLTSTRTPKPVCSRHALRVAPSLASTYTSAAERLGRTTTAIGESGEARSFCASSHADSCTSHPPGHRRGYLRG